MRSEEDPQFPEPSQCHRRNSCTSRYPVPSSRNKLHSDSPSRTSRIGRRDSRRRSRHYSHTKLDRSSRIPSRAAGYRFRSTTCPGPPSHSRHRNTNTQRPRLQVGRLAGEVARRRLPPLCDECDQSPAASVVPAPPRRQQRATTPPEASGWIWSERRP